ncbi:ribose-phosphate pyrophosphokinase [Thermosporothrix hazakensis]|uniref:Ribose-phosphate pyrophosphokinase n=2 Tax=Thermosporothrix TaxID=768650 RepID=A0A326U0V3_THEHA|nr:ribose-phosphate pyrophosphokinase [Thermosporothrix hazakensis]PZW22981.1 ribose-phosphate pyrophosphokinase [Thermosporothrix hazakensis]BBH90072.1 ribose-phosphate pyrophosphokinase [Thermosporothrix sp. COM3]GCE48293.1 ribose-phosphate pyrophosphokinase [Thermosporothrix hazakensis]
MDKLSIFTGNANRQLAIDICEHLHIPLGKADVFQFSNENIFVKINQNVRGHDVFVIQPFSSPVNRSIMELLIMIDALKRASAARITAVIPYYAYGRTDKKDQPRVPITARLIADCITVAGAQRVVSMDMHAGQIQGFFNIPVDELTAQTIQARYFAAKNISDLTVVSTDEGFAKKARKLADRLGAPLAIVEKRRLGNDGTTEALGLIGNVEGRRALIVDDEIDTAGSITQAARMVREHGAREIYLCATHGVFSGPAIERLAKAPIEELVITDTIPSPDAKRLPKLVVLSVSELLAGAISRIHDGRSVSELFN